MNDEHKVPKSISLTLRGFSLAADQVESMIGVPASLVARKGEPRRPGLKNFWSHSGVFYKLNVPNECRMDEMFPAILSYLGGVDHLWRIIQVVQPEFIEVDFILPVKRSEEQEGGFITTESIGDMARLNVSPSFGFV